MLERDETARRVVVDAGERTQDTALLGPRRVKQQERRDDLGAIAFVERRVRCDGATPIVEERAERKEEIARCTKAASLAKREEAVIFRRPSRLC